MGMLIHHHFVKWDEAEKASPAPHGDEKADGEGAQPKKRTKKANTDDK